MDKLKRKMNVMLMTGLVVFASIFGVGLNSVLSQPWSSIGSTATVVDDEVSATSISEDVDTVFISDEYFLNGASQVTSGQTLTSAIANHSRAQISNTLIEFNTTSAFDSSWNAKNVLLNNVILVYTGDATSGISMFADGVTPSSLMITDSIFFAKNGAGVEIPTELNNFSYKGFYYDTAEGLRGFSPSTSTLEATPNVSSTNKLGSPTGEVNVGLAYRVGFYTAEEYAIGATDATTKLWQSAWSFGLLGDDEEAGETGWIFAFDKVIGSNGDVLGSNLYPYPKAYSLKNTSNYFVTLYANSPQEEAKSGAIVLELTGSQTINLSETYRLSNLGYTQTGWKYYIDSEEKVGESVTVNGSTTLYATWELQNYNVTLNYDGGRDGNNNTSITLTNQNIETPVALPASTSITYPGHTAKANFWKVTTASGNWALGETFTSGESVEGKYGSPTLTAQWDANEYTVIFNGNGSTSGSMANQTFKYDVAKNLSNNAYIRTGYEFVGWNTQANGEGTAYTNGQSVKNLTTDGEITLYAQWEPEVYSVTLNLQGGKIGSETTKTLFLRYEHGWYATNADAEAGNTNTLSDATAYIPDKVGNDFDSASRDTKGNKVLGDATPSGLGTSNTLTVDYGSTNLSGTPTATLDGYNFLGWSTSRSATSASACQITAQGEVNGSWTASGDSRTANVYAIWQPKTYTVTLNRNNGTGGSASVEATYGASMPTATMPTRDGYTFGGYEYDNVTYYNASGASAHVWDVASEVTLVAQWDPVSYTVQLKVNKFYGDTDTFSITSSISVNGGVVTPTLSNAQTTASISNVEFGQTLTITLNAPADYYLSMTALSANPSMNASGVANGYDVTNHQVAFTNFDAISDNTFVINVYVYKIYEISYNGNGSTSGSTTSSYKVYGKTVNLANNNFNRTGYAFDKWHLNSASGTAYNAGQAYTSNADAVMYAGWTPNKYTITLNANGGTFDANDKREVTATYNEKLPNIAEANLPKRDGYTFNGYYDAQNGGTRYYNANGSAVDTPWTTDGEDTLYAQWAKGEYTITYQFGGQTIGTQKYYVDTEFDLGSTATLAGYQINHWTTSTNVGALVAGGYAWVAGTEYTHGTEITGKYGNVTLVADADPLLYTITLDVNSPVTTNNGIGSVTLEPDNSTIYVVYGTTTLYTTKSSEVAGSGDGTIVASLNGYVFKGWATSENGTPITNNQGGLLNAWTTPSGATLYAIWEEADTNKITYNLNSGSYSGATTVTYSPSEAFSLLGKEEVTREGYTLRGWLASNVSGGNWENNKEYAEGASFEVFSMYGPVTLTAQWTPNTYDVIINANGGAFADGETITVKATYASAMPQISVPTRNGYAFAGVWDKAEGGVQYYNTDGTSARTWDKAQDTTLYAHWTANTTIVTYNANADGATVTGLNYGARLVPGTNWTETDDGLWTRTLHGVTMTYNPQTNVFTLNGTYDTNNHNANAAFVGINTELFADLDISVGSYTFGYDVLTGSVENPGTEGAGNSNNIIGAYFFKGGEPWTVAHLSLGQAWLGKYSLEYTQNITSISDSGNSLQIVYLPGEGNSLPTFNNYQIRFYLYYNTPITNNQQTITHDENAYMPIAKREGYKFIGWNTEADGSGKFYSAGNIGELTGGNETLYAIWEAKRIPVAINLNKGSASTTPTYERTNLYIDYGTQNVYDAWVGGNKLTADDLIPTLPGYTFAGWSVNDATYINGDGTFTKNWDINYKSGNFTTLKANWTPKHIKVIANAGEGAFSNNDKERTYYFTFDGTIDQIYTDKTGANKATLEAPTRFLYDFDGYKDSAGNKVITYADGKFSFTRWTTLNTTNDEEAVEITAIYSEHGYQIEFASNGGNYEDGSSSDHLTLKVGTNFTTRGADDIYRDGYTFKGWALNSGATTPDFEAEEVVTSSEETTSDFYKIALNQALYAVWEENDYTVTYTAETDDTNVTLPIPSSFDYTYNSTNVLASATRTGYTFAGWITKTNVGEYHNGTFAWETGEVYSAGTSVKGKIGNVTLVATWTPHTYTVTFGANGGTGTQMQSQSFKYGEEKALSANTYTREGHTFLGWSTNSSASAPTYTDEQVVSNLTPTDNGTVELFAIWKANTYVVTLNTNLSSLINNGGSPTLSPDKTTLYVVYGSNKFYSTRTGNEQKDYAVSDEVTPMVTNLTGYTFDGWTLNNELITNASGVLTSNWNVADATLVAKYTPKEYTLTLNFASANSEATHSTNFTVAVSGDSETKTLNAGGSLAITKAFSDTALTVTLTKTGADEYLVATGAKPTESSKRNTISFTWTPSDSESKSIYVKEIYDIELVINKGNINTTTNAEKFHGINKTFTPSSTPNGYTFTGWLVSNASTGNGSTIAPNTAFTLNTDATLTAQFDPISYDITYTFDEKYTVYHGDTELQNNSYTAVDAYNVETNLTLLDNDDFTIYGYTIKNWTFVSGESKQRHAFK